MLRYLVPLMVFMGLVGLFALGLRNDPGHVPSPLIGQPVPDFVLPQLHAPEHTLSAEDLSGQVTLLNVWASWCVACLHEHPLLVNLARNRGIAIYGLNYKDRRDDALRWLERHGDPYVHSAFDLHGRVAIDLGVYGVPETYLVDAAGVIRYKHVGPLTQAVVEEQLLPLLVQLARREDG